MTRFALGMILAAALAGPAAAQGLDAEGAIDTIVGSEVQEQESTATADPARILAAIDKAGATAESVRKVTRVESLEIVFLTDSSAAHGGPPVDIEAKLEERKRETEALRQEIEGNALLYYAIDSRQVVMRDIMAVEIGDDQRVVVYAAARPAGG